MTPVPDAAALLRVDEGDKLGDGRGDVGEGLAGRRS
jgi:hypothetical protein